MSWLPAASSASVFRARSRSALISVHDLRRSVELALALYGQVPGKRRSRPQAALVVAFSWPAVRRRPTTRSKTKRRKGNTKLGLPRFRCSPWLARGEVAWANTGGHVCTNVHLLSPVSYNMSGIRLKPEQISRSMGFTSPMRRHSKMISR